jgi:hypothetical protein
MTNMPESGTEHAAAAMADPSADRGTIDYASEAPQPSRDGPASRYDMAIIAARLLAMYFISSAAPAIVLAPVLFLIGEGAGSFRYEIIQALPSAAQMIIGIAIWLLSKPFGRWALRDVPLAPSLPRSRVSTAQLQSQAFAVLGLLLVAFSLRHAPTIITYVIPSAVGGIYYDNSLALRAAVIEFAVELAFGVAVFFGAAGLTRMWQRVRASA